VNNAIVSLKERADKKGKLGVFWHTQGSGKSYSMIFFSRKIRRKIEDLKIFLSSNKSHVFTLIHKFGIEKGKTYQRLTDRSDWIVMVDEAHRSQYKGFGENMRIAIPNAQYIAFTGTPLLRSELTKDWFGPYVSEYNFSQSIADGATSKIR